MEYSTVPGETAMKKDSGLLTEEWSVVTRFLPEGWMDGAGEKIRGIVLVSRMGGPGRTVANPSHSRGPVELFSADGSADQARRACYGFGRCVTQALTSGRRVVSVDGRRGYGRLGEEGSSRDQPQWSSSEDHRWDHDSGAWFNGKLVVAFSVTAMITAEKSLFSWGYAISCQPQDKPLHLEGDPIDA
jgi:hypothetical protein